MAKTYFQFKQFRIDQDRVAMKVSTDACVQGAWTPIAPEARRVLDMGSGSGLLALFLAQRGPGLLIDALEIGEEDACQGAENLADSPWADRLHSIQGDHRTYYPPLPYDLICTNPPFYVDSLGAQAPERERVRHLSQEGLREWMDSVDRMLADGGRVSIQYPADRERIWVRELERIGLHKESELRVRPYASRPAYRVLGLWRRPEPAKAIPQSRSMDLSIYQGKGRGYSPEFRTLMQDFYLFL